MVGAGEGFDALLEDIRRAESMISTGQLQPSKREADSVVLQRSLYVVEDVKRDDPLTEKDVRSIRPGRGLAPGFLSEVLARPAATDTERGTPLSWKLLLR